MLIQGDRETRGSVLINTLNSAAVFTPTVCFLLCKSVSQVARLNASQLGSVLTLLCCVFVGESVNSRGAKIDISALNKMDEGNVDICSSWLMAPGVILIEVQRFISAWKKKKKLQEK